jgi:hypothetical protein
MRTSLVTVRLLLTGIGLTLLASSIGGQSTGKSPSEIIVSITGPTTKRDGLVATKMFSCGITTQDEQDRALAAQLAHEGPSATAQLEHVFDSLQTQGTESTYFEHADWFFLAYASMLGPSASERLRTMIADPKFVSLQVALDRALAVSLGITSYISSVRKFGPGDLCRRAEPRDALDELIAAFEQGEFSRLAPVIGPAAVATLGQMEGGRSWEEFHRAVWRVPPRRQSAVGYVFNIRGRWSEPEQVLEGPSRYARNYGDAPVLADDFYLVTSFRTDSGQDCGDYVLNFHTVPDGVRVRYQINNEDLDGLIRLINTCFVR